MSDQAQHLSIARLEKGHVLRGSKYLLKSCILKWTSTTPSKPYFDMVISDKTGDIPAKLWDADETTEWSCPVVVELDGIVEVYRDKPQLKVTSIGSLPAEPLEDFIKTADASEKELRLSIKEVISSLKHEVYKKIVHRCFSKYWNEFFKSAAAKSMHHAYYGGLAYHTLRMVKIAEQICAERTMINRDLLISGILLHDMMKLAEFQQELGVVSDYTLEGKLIGHISLISNEIVKVCLEENIDPQCEDVILLQHVILAHHGTGEWGSPVVPQTIEAVAIHYIDQLDAKLQAAEDALKSLNSSTSWTPDLTMFDRKRLYKHKLGNYDI